MTANTASEVDDKGRPHVLVNLIFLLSGAAGLTAEVSWSRQVGLAVGNTAPAVALVFAAYFVGLAIGQALVARLAPRIRPLLGYGVAELLSAAWGARSRACWHGSPLPDRPGPATNRRGMRRPPYAAGGAS